MDISSAVQSQIASVKSAINITALQNSMKQDGVLLSKLIEGMEGVTYEVQKAAETYRGINIDNRI